MSPQKGRKNRRNKRSEVLGAVRKRIVDGDYPQGVKLIEVAEGERVVSLARVAEED